MNDRTSTPRRSSASIPLLLIALLLTGFVLRLAQDVIITLLVALLLAYLMDPLARLLYRRLAFPLWLAVLLTAVLFLGIFFVFGGLIYLSLLEFARDFPGYQSRFSQLIRDLVARVQTWWPEVVRGQIVDEVRRIPLASIALGAVRSVFSNLTRFLVVFLFSLIILYGKQYLIRKVLLSFPRKGKRVARVLLHIDEGLRKYIGVKTLMSVMVGTGTAVVLLLFGVQFAVILGAATFLLNFIPYVGSTIAVLLPILVALAQWAEPVRALWIFVILVLLQNLIGSLLEPKVVGDRLKLSIAVVFFSLLFWGWLWGPAGVFLAIPMTTSVKVILANIPSLRGAARFLEPLRASRRAWHP